MLSLVSLTFCTIIPLALAQFVAPPVNQTILRSPTNPSIHVAYKAPPPGTCTTSNPNQRQYAGYVHLPPGTLSPVEQTYPINTFFWFFEARNNASSAPLTIWLNGGPGSSSLMGMMNEVGPCSVVPVGDEELKTEPRQWGWDRASNILFIDQPNFTGFSYDTPTNGSLPLLAFNSHYKPGKIAPPVEQQPLLSQVELRNPSTEAYLEAILSTLLINGTFPSGDKRHTANTTQIAARAAWWFLQTWLQEFPQYNTESRGVNLFAESYGGKYGPSFFEFFEEQNQRRRAGDLDPDSTLELHLDSLGIVNGCVDAEIQTPSYPIYAHENPYGIEAITKTQRDEALDSFYQEGGCRDQIRECRTLQNALDRNDFGNDQMVNHVCEKANAACDSIRESYRLSGRSYYDISQAQNDPFPPRWYLEYMNNATVQSAIGAPINFTESDINVFDVFRTTGDYVRAGQLSSLSQLLDSGVRIALIYGDRDYICNYLGGESISLAINHSSATQFAEAGYQNIDIPDSDPVGQVRQHGNLSFTRVYQAGHLVPAYAPHAAFAIFWRVIHGRSIATGQTTIPGGVYSTFGEQNTTKTLEAPPMSKPTCWLRDVTTCNASEWFAIGERRVVIKNGVVVGLNETRTGSSLGKRAGVTAEDDGEVTGEPGSGAVKTGVVGAFVLAGIAVVLLGIL